MNDKNLPPDETVSLDENRPLPELLEFYHPLEWSLLMNPFVEAARRPDATPAHVAVVATAALIRAEARRSPLEKKQSGVMIPRGNEEVCARYPALILEAARWAFNFVAERSIRSRQYNDPPWEPEHPWETEPQEGG